MTVSDETLDRLEQYAKWYPNCRYEHISRTRDTTWIFCDRLTERGTPWTTRRVAIGDIDEEDCKAICEVMNELPGLIADLRAARANERRYRGVINVLADKLATWTGKTVPCEIERAEAVVDRNQEKAAIDAAGGNDG